MIADFKKRLFCQITGTKHQEVDANDSMWVARIDHTLQARSILPPPGDPREYAKAFEAVYPSPQLRRAYIEDAIRKGTPSFGHRALASLISTRRIPCIFTTNFDPLVEDASTLTDQLLPADERARLTVAAIDNAGRAELALTESRPFLAKLHGDYQSLELKNTPNELQAQDARMRKVLMNACGRFGLVVVGYSGRDDSIMEALTAACAQANRFPSGIYWITARPDSVLPAVSAFLEKAASAGVPCSLVDSQTFDELASDVVSTFKLPAVLNDHVYKGRDDSFVTNVAVPTSESRNFPVLQCSAIPIASMPKVARRITLSKPATPPEVKELLRKANVWAVTAPNGPDLAVFGPDAPILSALSPLGAKLAGTVDLNPEKDSWALGLLYTALTRAICRGRPLFARMRRAGHLVLVAKGPSKEDAEKAAARAAQLTALREAYPSGLVGTVPEHNFPFYEGVEIRIEYAADRWWCVFEPLTYVELPRADPPPTTDTLQGQAIRPLDPTADWRRERWATRYNRVWARIIASWADMLAGNGVVHATGVANAEGIDGTFELLNVTAWSRPGNDHVYFNR